MQYRELECVSEVNFSFQPALTQAPVLTDTRTTELTKLLLVLGPLEQLYLRHMEMLNVDELSCSKVLSATVNSNTFSSYKLCLIRDQECNKLTYFLRLANSSQTCGKRVGNIDASL